MRSYLWIINLNTIFLVTLLDLIYNCTFIYTDRALISHNVDGVYRHDGCHGTHVLLALADWNDHSTRGTQDVVVLGRGDIRHGVHDTQTRLGLQMFSEIVRAVLACKHFRLTLAHDTWSLTTRAQMWRDGTDGIELLLTSVLTARTCIARALQTNLAVVLKRKC